MASPKKPPALARGARIRMISPSSPPAQELVSLGLAELRRLGYQPVISRRPAAPSAYFAAAARERAKAFSAAIADRNVGAVVSSRGGYGSAYLLDGNLVPTGTPPKIVLGYSDITAIQSFLWRRHRWITFYGPMVASGFCSGSGTVDGYDEPSFTAAVTETRNGWSLELNGETLVPGEARGALLGGCLTLLETTLGTPWEVDARGAILVLEDHSMKPYELDRTLTHLRQAKKFAGVRGIILGEFPKSPEPPAGGFSVRDVAQRIFSALKIPTVWGAPVGHTGQPMLTLPLGVRAQLHARGAGKLDILEPAVTA
jgi:muramoyltetrapeptide carboxypeptidase